MKDEQQRVRMLIVSVNNVLLCQCCQTSRWLSRAELIKNYLSVKDLPADGVGQTEEDATSFVTCQLIFFINASHSVQWRRNRGFRRFSEPGTPSS